MASPGWYGSHRYNLGTPTGVRVECAANSWVGGARNKSRTSPMLTYHYLPPSTSSHHVFIVDKTGLGRSCWTPDENCYTLGGRHCFPYGVWFKPPQTMGLVCDRPSRRRGKRRIKKCFDLLRRELGRAWDSLSCSIAHMYCVCKINREHPLSQQNMFRSGPLTLHQSSSLS